jgi:hypothetical protein
MITIFRRPNKIHVDCFTWVTDLPKLYPILLAGQRIPDFIKNIPTTVKTPTGPSRGTMKTCPGVNDLFKSGIIIQAWSDIYLNWANPNNLYAEPEGAAESHSSLQWNNVSSFKDLFHFKLNSPWKFKEKSGVSFLMTNTYWHHTNTPYFVPNGVVEYKYQYTTNVNTWVNKNSFPKEVTIPAGKELCQLIPFSEKEIVLHQHEISTNEFLKLKTVFFNFNAQYLKRKKILGSK